MPIPPRNYTLPCTPATTVWGHFCPDIKPVLRIESGARVAIDTVNGVGVPQDDPASFFAANGMPVTEAARDLVAVMSMLEKGAGPHILTGPIQIAGAEPGDVLEVRVLAVRPRAPYYGVSYTRPGAGSLPDLVPRPWSKVVRFDMERGLARFRQGVDIPLAPFMGVMAVSPAQRASSLPPGPFGGNLGLKLLRAGARLYLPVQVPGALFYTGDGHAAQGNGAVNLTGLEASMSATLQFVLHKRCPQAWPLAETHGSYVVMGLHEDLDIAAAQAVEQAVRAIGIFGQMPEAEAYAAASLLVDFSLTQVVAGVKGVHGRIDKKHFQHVTRPWWGPRWV